MNTNITLSTTNTPRVRDGLRKDGTVLITKRGYIMWLKKLHDEDPQQTIAIISRYSAAASPIGQYCKSMGLSVYDAPKWAQKVREFYADKMHGMMYTAFSTVYHMVELFGYKCSDIFNGTEEEAVSSNPIKVKAPKQPKVVKEAVKPAFVAPEPVISQEHAANPSQQRIDDFVELSNGIIVHRYNISTTSFVEYMVYERYNDHNGFTYDAKYGRLGDITTKPVSQDIKALRLGSKERCAAVDAHYAALRSLKGQYVHEAFGR